MKKDIVHVTFEKRSTPFHICLIISVFCDKHSDRSSDIELLTLKQQKNSFFPTEVRLELVIINTR